MYFKNNILFMQVWVGKGTESSRLTKKEKKLETSKCHFFKETCVVMEPFMVWWMHLICVLFMHAFHSSSIGWERGQVGPLFKLNQDWKARATVIFPLLGEFTFSNAFLLQMYPREVKEIYKNSYLTCGFHSKLPQITPGNE